ncbi:MAG: hypothetical protein ABI172_06915 [Ginsengibacter sp.]
MNSILLPLIGEVMACDYTGSSSLNIDTLPDGHSLPDITGLSRPGFGGGYLRTLFFDIDKHTLSAKIYSPY